MGDNQNQNSMSEQIKDAVSDALKTGDFKELNNLVSQTVTTALNEVGRRVGTDNGRNTSAGGRYSGGAGYGGGTSGNGYGSTGGADGNGYSGAENTGGNSCGGAGSTGGNSGSSAGSTGGNSGGAESTGSGSYSRASAANNNAGGAYSGGSGGAGGAGGSGGGAGGSAGAAGAGSINIPLWQQRAQERVRKKQLEIQHDFQEHIQRRRDQMQQNARTQPDIQTQQNPQAQYQNADGQENPRVIQTQNLQWSSPNLPSVKMRRVGKVSNVLYQIFGGIGLGISALVLLIRMFVFLSGDTTLGGWIVNFAFLALFYGMIQHGVEQKKRLKRAVRYVQLCGHKMYGDIEQLAKSIGTNVRFVVKDLRKMLKLGIFPEGHLDEQKTCLMLNDTIYRQYLETEENRRRREEESKAALAQTKNADAQPAQPAPEVSQEEASELDTMIAEGMECIRKLRDLNDRISGEVISAKLFRLENLLKDIFDSVKEHPDQMHRMHKLMNYYLPTTLKLVEAYENFDRVSSPGEEIIKAKAEIENTLDTINQAFTELLNNLFQDAVFDATTDAQVLKTMLAKEGLMREMELVPNRRK